MTTGTGRPIVLPLLLIALGTSLLLLNLGIIPWQAVRDVLRFWPVVFILLGIEALLTRRVPWGALILAILISVVFGASGWMRPGSWQRPGAASAMPATLRAQTLDGATQAVVSFTAGGARLRLDALSEPGALAHWLAHGQGGQASDADYRVRDGVGRLDLDLSRARPFARFWDPSVDGQGSERNDPSETQLQLTTAVPLEIEARVGASDAVIDLRELNTRRVALDAGASNMTIYLSSRAESSSVLLRGGASHLIVIVPEDANAHITSAGGLSSLHVDPNRFRPTPGDDSAYQSLNVAPESHRLELELRLGAASVEIR